MLPTSMKKGGISKKRKHLCKYNKVSHFKYKNDVTLAYLKKIYISFHIVEGLFKLTEPQPLWHHDTATYKITGIKMLSHVYFRPFPGV